MKKAFLCVNYPKFNMAIGISKKISSQIKTLQELGFDVYYSAYLEDGIAIFHNDEIVSFKKVSPHFFYTFFRRFILLSECLKFLKEERRFDLGFIRWDPIDRLFIRVLKALDKKCEKVLMDFHGYFPGYTGKGLKGKYTEITTKINGNKLSKYVDYGLVELNSSSVFNIKTLPIDTCINVEEYPRHAFNGSCSELSMISVANETTYHGYDRIIKGMHQYLNNKSNDNSVSLHLVGNISKRTRKLVKKLKLEKNVTLYGYKNGSELFELYNKCNVGVGPLAPHRTGGKQGTGIKTKEFFAMGIPYFYAGNELLVPKDYKYTYRVEDDDEPIDINCIYSFLNTFCQDNERMDKMRAFAKEHFSWTDVFSRALKEMEILKS